MTRLPILLSRCHTATPQFKKQRVKKPESADKSSPDKDSEEESQQKNKCKEQSQQDDDNFSQILALYYPKLLPRLTYLAGSSTSIGFNRSWFSDESADASTKSLDSLKLIMGDPEGLMALERIAFTPQVMKTGWITWVRFSLKDFKNSVLERLAPEELSLARTKRLVAIAAIEGRLEEIRKPIEPYK